MTTDQLSTKNALIEAAGQLFADLGFDGASIREIAKRANANMAAIGYHFNGKENLYRETLRVVVNHKSHWSDAMLDALEQTQGGTPVPKALKSVFRNRLDELFGRDKPRWHIKLFIRALLEPSPALKEITQENLVGEFEAMCAAARAWNPALTEAQAMRWTDAFFAQEIYYVLGQAVIQQMANWDAYPGTYLDEIAAHVARLQTAALWPDELEAHIAQKEGGK